MTLSKVTKLGYGVGHVLNDLCASLWFTYGLVYYSAIVELKNIDAGLLILIGQITDAIATPIIGYLSDRIVLNKRLSASQGRRKIWHLIGTVGVGLTIPFMYTLSPNHDSSSYLVKMIYYGTLIAVFQISWATVQISHLSLASELTMDANERTQLLSYRTAFTVLSNMIVYSVAWGVLAVNFRRTSISGISSSKFMQIVYPIVGFGLLMSIVFHVTVKETAISLKRHEPLPKRKPLRSIFVKVILYQVAVVNMCARLFGSLLQVQIPFYVSSIMTIGAQSIAIVPFVMYISSFITSLFVGPMNKKFGRKIVFLYGSLVGSVGVLAVAFGSGDMYATYLIYITAILLGSCQSAYLITSLAITADLIGLDVGNGAFINGLLSCTDKVSGGVAVMILQAMVPDEIGLFYQWSLVVSCGSAIALGTLAILTSKGLRKKPKVKEEKQNKISKKDSR